jgi:hypothetical protein
MTLPISRPDDIFRTLKVLRGHGMRQLLTFEDVKLSVESCYPTPVATVFRKCRIANKQDLGGRHKNLIDLFESFVKFLCIVQLQEARQCVANLKERLPQKEKTLEFLKRPSLGGWLSLLRILCNVEYGPSKPRWGNVIAPWYQQPRTPETAEALSLFGEIRDVPFDARSRAPIAEICNALVGYRNKHLAHAANFTDDDLSARLPLLEAVLSHLIRSADFLGPLTRSSPWSAPSTS